jgi:hypothetical protein
MARSRRGVPEVCTEDQRRIEWGCRPRRRTSGLGNLDLCASTHTGPPKVEVEIMVQHSSAQLEPRVVVLVCVLLFPVAVQLDSTH